MIVYPQPVVRCGHGAVWRWWDDLHRWEQTAHIKGCDHKEPLWRPYWFTRLGNEEVTDVRRCLDCRAVIATIEDIARGVARGCDCPPTCFHPHLPAMADRTLGFPEEETAK